jgi:hypothetical protein
MANGENKVEIRVPGIGDRSFFAVLGEPPPFDRSKRVETADAPTLPSHRLRMVNWSRAYRQLTRSFFWYLAVPFTFINVVGHMGAREGRSGIALHWAMLAAGLVLTAGQFGWTIVLAETVLRRAPDALNQPWTGPAVVWGVAAAMSAVLLYRGLTLGPGGPGQRRRPVLGHALLHTVLVAAAAGAIAVFRPAAAVVEPADLLPSVDEERSRAGLDAMIVGVWGSTLLVLLAALVLLSLSFLGAGRRQRRHYAGASALLAGAVVLLHSVNALLRTALEIVVTYVAGFLDPDAAGPAPQRWEPILLAPDDPATLTDNRLAVVPLEGFFFGMALLAVLYLILRRLPDVGTIPPRRHRTGQLRWLHRARAALPEAMARPALAVPGLLSIGFAWAIEWWMSEAEEELWLRLVVLGMHAGAVLLLLLVVFGQFDSVREIIGRIGDVAGFWPVTHHPLSGLSYRGAVAEGIREEIDARDSAVVVLTAHSQGGVICAWLLSGRHGPRPERPVHLVTCGSPLESLYATYFPRYFDRSLFDDVQDATVTWRNFWRDTDIIGGPVQRDHPARPVDQQLADPRGGGAPQGHSNYWVDPVQMAYIAGLPATDPPLPYPV